MKWAAILAVLAGLDSLAGGALAEHTEPAQAKKIFDLVNSYYGPFGCQSPNTPSCAWS